MKGYIIHSDLLDFLKNCLGLKMIHSCLGVVFCGIIFEAFSISRFQEKNDPLDAAVFYLAILLCKASGLFTVIRTRRVSTSISLFFYFYFLKKIICFDFFSIFSGFSKFSFYLKKKRFKLNFKLIQFYF